MLAVNFFGAGTGTGGPTSGRLRTGCSSRTTARSVLALAVGSNADFAFSSLRKTLPVPDGGILWSPRELDLPPQPRGSADGSELKLAAMLLKGRHLEGRGGDDLKQRFRRLQLEGEEQPARSPVAAASPAAREAVIGGAPLPWRVRRSDNAVHLLGLIADLETAEPVFDEWPAAPRRSASCSRSGRRPARPRTRDASRGRRVLPDPLANRKAGIGARARSSTRADDPDRLALHGRGHGASRRPSARPSKMIDARSCGAGCAI